MRLYLSLVALVLSFVVVYGLEDEETSTDTSHWIDPHNMVYEYPQPGVKAGKNPEDSITAAFANIQDELTSCKEKLAKVSTEEIPIHETAPSDTPYLKQFVRALLDATRGVIQPSHTEIRLNPEKRELLQNFLDDKGNVHDVTVILLDSITNQTLSHTLMDNYWGFVSPLFDRGTFVYITVAILLMMTVVTFQMRTRMTPRQQLVYLVLVSFIISIPWEWCRLYKKEFAAKQSIMRENIQRHCHTDHDLGPFESVSLWWKSTFTIGDSSCSKYQEALLVDAIWEVPPSMAVSVTLTRFVVQPFEHIADATGKSFRALFQHLPFQWQPVMFLACLVVVMVCLFLASGIHIRTPLFQVGFGTEPGANANLQRIEQQMQDLLQQQAAIQNAPPPAIENLHVVNNEQHQAILNTVKAIDKKYERQKVQLREIKGMLKKRPAVEHEAPPMLAVEHQDWEVVGGNPVAEGRNPIRLPVEDSESPTENIGPNIH